MGNKNFINEMALILLGALISSLGINLFIVNANILSGGITGLALVLQYIIDFPMGYTIFLLNLPLLILSWLKLDRKFTIYTLVGTLSFSLFLVLTKDLKSLITIQDSFLLCVYGGIIAGFGYGLVLNNHGSTGGLDIVSTLIRKKRPHIKFGNISLSINIIILILAGYFFSIDKALYTFVAMFCTSFMMDKVITGFNKELVLFIITTKENEVKDFVLNMGRGITFMTATGGYTNETKKMAYVIIKPNELPILKSGLLELDNSVFISVIESSEIHGKGFK